VIAQSDSQRPAVSHIVNEVFSSCTYVIDPAAEGDVTLVDCGDVLALPHATLVRCRTVLLTHAHFDHIYGLNQLLRVAPQALIYTNAEGREALLSDKLNLSKYHGDPFVIAHPQQVRVVTDGEAVHLTPSLVATAMFTPGHNPSCITWMVGDDAMFTGDSYIPGINVVTNIPRANRAQAAASLQRILALAPTHTIYPGHSPQDE